MSRVRESKSGRGAWAIIGLLVFVGAYIFSATDAGKDFLSSRPVPTNENYTTEAISNQLMAPQDKPAPPVIPTVYPTYTPYPTLIPPDPVVIYEVREVAPAADFSHWGWGVLAIFVIGLSFLTILVFREVVLTDRKHAHKLALERLEAEKEVAIAMARGEEVEPRALVVNRSQASGGRIVELNGKTISASRMTEFVDNFEDVGLTISQWRTQMEWSQNDIETVLDILSDLRLVTPRAQGVESRWRRRVTPGELRQRFSL